MADELKNYEIEDDDLDGASGGAGEDLLRARAISFTLTNGRCLFCDEPVEKSNGAVVKHLLTCQSVPPSLR